jgi:hypothetical protein
MFGLYYTYPTSSSIEAVKTEEGTTLFSQEMIHI